MRTEKQDSTGHDICLTCFPFKSALAGFHLASIRAIETMLLPISVKIGGSGIRLRHVLYCPYPGVRFCRHVDHRFNKA
jgi:hypothetical protein